MSQTCIARLKKELAKLQADPNTYFETVPLPNNIRTWHYVLKGPEDTPFYGGYYHGVIKFPHDYPFKPPSIVIFTPNGRFKTNTRICLSNSDFHPESWSPFWSLSNILTGFLSYMCEESESSIGGIGSLQTTKQFKIECAMKSMTFNNKNELFVKLFPKYNKLYVTNKEKFDNAHIHSNFFAQNRMNQKNRSNSKNDSNTNLRNRRNNNTNDANNANGENNNSHNSNDSNGKNLSYMEKLHQSHQNFKRNNQNQRNENIKLLIMALIALAFLAAVVWLLAQ